ncbi:hypothetical protein C2E25_13480 [Geothermobacter hydrogeniphilus]|uniref:PPM-type phosphatase domain-containing protein n=1 Tax=Geothermobacter hydrogeniphilus TaxID=1969733 RepID=A0A2K2H7D6_9BACT|nr:PP2C family protein-serine/threonine phosphatase [Geothermobacter hydrogeniphilus]PNU19218.1 hypothetical protein C2E25_13480 [Geothermobacter hydrogeniphilus]
MAEELLIAHSAAPLGEELAGLLQDAGFSVTTADNLCTAQTALSRFPDLLLLDLDLADDPMTDLEPLAQGCLTGEIPCLLFSSLGMDPDRMRTLAPWSSGPLLSAEQRDLVLDQVRLQLELVRLRAERDLLAGRLEAKKIELREGLRSAAIIQQSLLPNFLPRSDSFRFAWRFRPCETVGGDLFHLRQVAEDSLMAYLLDVSGHGVSAAMVTVSVYQSLSPHTSQLIKQPLDHPPHYRLSTPAEVITELDREYPYERFEKFFTMAYLLLDPNSGQVRYCNAGHPPPLLVRRDGTVETLDVGGTLVGMGGLIPFEEDRLQLYPGDRLFLYSDGVTELPDPEGELFGEERFFDLLENGADNPLDEQLEMVMKVLDRFSGGQPPPDDLTLLAIEYRPNGHR